mmetsp:Transcript_44334/g.99961  ORF Transcript_44334/g.99961 Transcript_44334/m.99961 type:complete len:232 (+) Transcript_44334:1328-2023(+)
MQDSYALPGRPNQKRGQVPPELEDGVTGSHRILSSRHPLHPQRQAPSRRQKRRSGGQGHGHLCGLQTDQQLFHHIQCLRKNAGPAALRENDSRNGFADSLSDLHAWQGDTHCCAQRIGQQLHHFPGWRQNIAGCLHRAKNHKSVVGALSKLEHWSNSRFHCAVWYLLHEEPVPGHRHYPHVICGEDNDNMVASRRRPGVDDADAGRWQQPPAKQPRLPGQLLLGAQIPGRD